MKNTPKMKSEPHYGVLSQSKEKREVKPPLEHHLTRPLGP